MIPFDPPPFSEFIAELGGFIHPVEVCCYGLALQQGFKQGLGAERVTGGRQELRLADIANPEAGTHVGTCHACVVLCANICIYWYQHHSLFIFTRGRVLDNTSRVFMNSFDHPPTY